MKKPKKAVIIGSGFGGLSLGIRLQAKGIKTTIYEKQNAPGGHAMQGKERGYTFDLGPSLITATEIIEELFQLTGKKLSDYLSMTKLDPSYRIFFHDKTYFDYYSDYEKMESEIAKFSEEDSRNYKKFYEYSKQMYEEVIVKELGATPFDNISVLLNFIPKAIKLNALLPNYNIVSRFFKSPKNRFVFSFHPLFIGGNPWRSPAVFLMIPYLEMVGGVWFSQGGMYSLVKALSKSFTEMGGKILTKSEVASINIADHKTTGITLKNGESIDSDLVISNAHFAHTYMDLIESKHRTKWKDKKILRKRYSMSSFLIYLGVRKKYPQLKHHTLIISSRYKELIKDIFDRKVLADDFSMYLHVPTKTDPTMAPDGCESMYVLIPVPNLSSNIDWTKTKDIYTEKILKFLENDFGLEELARNIEVLKVMTPLDFESDRNNHLGACWSLEPEIFQIANFRPHNKSEEIQNLYLVGASTHPGGGVPGVMLSAKTTYNTIIRDFAL